VPHSGNILEKVKRHFAGKNFSFVLLNVLFIGAFVVPFLMLYFFDPPLFNYSWKGRAPYVLFLCLFLAELILGWTRFKANAKPLSHRRIAVAAACLLLPSLYAVGLTVFGLGNAILDVGKAVGVPFATFGIWYLDVSWLLSVEILLFTVFFTCSIWGLYGKSGLKHLSVAPFFLGAVGVFYLLDTFYPYGSLTFLQSIVPFTTSAASGVLNMLGYATRTFPAGVEGLGLAVTGTGGKEYDAIISWSCAGIQSLVIYTFVLLLFLRGTGIPTLRKAAYAVVGFVGTFLVNVFRIASIFTMGINSGTDAAEIFHQSYGELFFFAWIISFLFVIFLVETALARRLSVPVKG